MLEVKDLKMYFPVKSGLLRRTTGFVKAVDGVTFSVGKAETLGLVGESGCGKTTVGRCIVRLLRPTDGSILFEDNDIAGLNARDLKSYRKKMQIVFQDPFGSLNPRMIVSNIVGEGPAIAGEKSVDKKVGEILATVGLSSADGSRYPHEFSGGQRQRISIARALAMGPSFIVCDEPVSALDVSIQAQIINLLEELQAKFSLSLLFIAHDLAVVRHIADRIAVMYLGKLMEEAPTEELFDNPLHPYTKALFASIPSLDCTKRRLQNSTGGEHPAQLVLPAGCRFASRCPQSTTACRKDEIELAEVSPNHRVRCIRYAYSISKSTVH
jgi:oligopeptide/dipeptide ABC transporter ATP-binding protein